MLRGNTLRCRGVMSGEIARAGGDGARAYLTCTAPHVGRNRVGPWSEVGSCQHAPRGGRESGDEALMHWVEGEVFGGDASGVSKP